MPSYTTHPTLSPVDTYLTTHAAALLAYAATDTTFAESLASVVQASGWPSNPTKYTSTDLHSASHFLMPTDQSAALTTTHWLLTTLCNTPEAVSARNTLTAFASLYDEPKNIVIGIVGVAVIGPTLGLIEQKKKKKPRAELVVDATWLTTQSPATLAKIATEATQRVIAYELRLAGGTITKLHPDTADWMMSESSVLLHTAPSSELPTVAHAATTEKLSHTTHSQTGRIVLVAMSPQVNDTFVAGFDTKLLK